MSEEPIRPRDAATVILVRHGEPVGEPWQCFMVRRHIRSDFAADVFVFPGGKVDEADYAPELAQYVTAHPLTADEPWGLEGWRAARLAAIRELFEEAGVLLAVREERLVSLTGDEEKRFERYRKELHNQHEWLLRVAQAERLKYALDRLHPFSRWITPEPMHRRYDTRFFVAYVPESQEPLHDAVETTESVWIAPRIALERWAAGDFPLVFATQKHLERMARYPSIEAMIAATAASDLDPIMPKVVEHEGKQDFLIPGDPGYGSK